MNIPVEVIEAVEKGRCVVFVGPRFTAEAAEAQGRSIPEARQLAKELGWRPPRRIMGSAVKHKGPVIPSVLQGASRYQQTHGRDALVSRLKLTLGAGGVPPTAAHALVLKHSPLIVTTVMDDMLERAAAQAGVPFEVRYRGDARVEAEAGKTVIYKLRGGFEAPETLVLAREDRTPLDAAAPGFRKLLRNKVVLFVGYKPDEEDFEVLWADLTACYGGELPRCHLAVAQGRIDDYLWQKWVWRGLLMFTADPTECMQALDGQVG